MLPDDILDASAEPEHQPLVYSTFWSRVGASIIDGIALGGFSIFISIYLDHVSDLVMALAILGFEIFLYVFLVKTYGATPGKLALNLRIAGTNGTPITWGQAILRNSVWFVISLVTSALPFLMASFPVFASALEQGLSIVTIAWTLITAAVMGYTSPQLRAPHDFMAGTVVVRNPDVHGSIL